MIYQWNPGSRPGVKDAQAVGERLEKLRRRDHGSLKAEAVVEDARPKGSLLHPAFEWNDRKAAEEHRLQQARQLIAAVVVKHENKTLAPAVRAFVVVGARGSDERGYTSIEVALADPSMRAMVLSRAKAELLAWKARYEELQEFASVVKAIKSSVEAA